MLAKVETRKVRHNPFEVVKKDRRLQQTASNCLLHHNKLVSDTCLSHQSLQPPPHPHCLHRVCAQLKTSLSLKITARKAVNGSCSRASVDESDRIANTSHPTAAASVLHVLQHLHKFGCVVESCCTCAGGYPSSTIRVDGAVSERAAGQEGQVDSMHVACLVDHNLVVIFNLTENVVSCKPSRYHGGGGRSSSSNVKQEVLRNSTQRKSNDSH